MGIVWGRQAGGQDRTDQRSSPRTSASVIHLGIGVAPGGGAADVHASLPDGIDLGAGADPQPFASWDRAITVVAEAASDEPLLLVLDEFPELLASDPHHRGQTLRAVWEKVIAVRIQAQAAAVRLGRAHDVVDRRGADRALYGRFDLRLLVHPFRPHEAALMLRHLKPAERAVVWGICGGTPLYLSWWDQCADLAYQHAGAGSARPRPCCATEARAGPGHRRGCRWPGQTGAERDRPRQEPALRDQSTR